MTQINRRYWMLAAATAVVLGVAYGPLLVDFFAAQWGRPQYQYFPFVIGAFVWLLWQRCGQAEPREDSDPAAHGYDVIVSLVAAWVLLGLAYLANSPWIGYLSLICLVTSCFLQIGRHWKVTYLWGIWLLLWMVVPLPLNRDQQLISFLQLVSSRLSSVVLDWVGVVHLMEGNTLRLADKRFFVDEACSGIISVMSIIACAVIYGVWRNRPPLHLITLAVAGVGWATLMNVARISVIAMAYQWYGVDWSKGTPHEMLGLVIFLVSFLALVSTDYALVFSLAPIKAPDGQFYGEPPRFGVWLVDAWDWLQGVGRPALGVAIAGSTEQGARIRPGTGLRDPAVDARYSMLDAGSSGVERQSSGEEVQTASHPHPGPLPKGEGIGTGLARRFVFGVVPLVAFGVLAGAQFAVPMLYQKQASTPTESLERALALDEGALPKRCATVDQASFTPQERERDDLFGNFSRTYEYRDERGKTYIVSCDFPLEPDGHELTVCYQGIGWEMTRREVRDMAAEGGAAEEGAGEEWGFAEADFHKPEAGHAFLVFCGFDEHGSRITPRIYSLWADTWRSLQRQFYATRSERTFQLQVWTTGAGEIDEAQKQTARELLLAVRERLRGLVVGE